MRVIIGDRPSSIRYAVGHSDLNPAEAGEGWLMMGVGSALVLGTLKSYQDTQMGPGGTALVMGGVAVALLGSVLARTTPERQNGAGIHYELPPQLGRDQVSAATVSAETDRLQPAPAIGSR
jgi:hypothetical protein